jgi:hypothetical protein
MTNLIVALSSMASAPECFGPAFRKSCASSKVTDRKSSPKRVFCTIESYAATRLGFCHGKVFDVILGNIKSRWNSCESAWSNSKPADKTESKNTPYGWPESTSSNEAVLTLRMGQIVPKIPSEKNLR